MAHITIDIPDDLAQRLAPYQSQFFNCHALIATAVTGKIDVRDAGTL